MSFDQIVSAVMEQVELTSSEATARIGRLVNQIHKRVTASVGLQVSRRTEAQSNASLGSTLVTFSGVTKLHRVEDRTTTPYRILDEVSVDELADQPIADSDSPTMYAVYSVTAGSVTIKTNVNAQTAYTLYAEGLDRADTMSGSDEPAIPEDFHDILISGAVSEERLRQEKTQLAQIARLEYEDRLGDLRLFVAKSANQQMYQGKRRGGAVLGGSAASVSGGAANGASSYTQSGLITFDRTSAAEGSRYPFAVASGSEKVDNLDADKLDGLDSTAFRQTSDPIVNADIDNAAAIAWTKISKTGSSLADLATRSAGDLSSGTLPDGRFPATLPAASGANLTSLNASNLASGTVSLARLSSFVGTAYTPTWAGSGSNPAIGNGSLTGKYIQIGKLVFFEIIQSMGSTTTFGSGVWTWSLPVAAAVSNGGAFPVYCLDLGTAHFIAVGHLTTSAAFLITSNDDVASGFTPSSPFVWANGDRIHVQGFYFAA
jgi:hypothetical protein